LLASNIFWHSGVKAGTLLLNPRSPQSRHVPPPPYPPGVPLQLELPDADHGTVITQSMPEIFKFFKEHTL
jgi:hypothetical protein